MSVSHGCQNNESHVQQADIEVTVEGFEPHKLNSFLSTRNAHLAHLLSILNTHFSGYGTRLFGNIPEKCSPHRTKR
jgi:hypothetical protein